MFKEDSKIVKYFLRIKEEYKNVPVIFLSERFYELYKILSLTYPQIKFPIVITASEYQKLGLNINGVFVNDIMFECDLKFKPGDKLEIFKRSRIVYDTLRCLEEDDINLYFSEEEIKKISCLVRKEYVTDLADIVKFIYNSSYEDNNVSFMSTYLFLKGEIELLLANGVDMENIELPERYKIIFDKIENEKRVR